MFHLNPSSFRDEKVLRRLEISRLRGWKPKVLYSVQLSFCRLRVLDSGSTGEREIDWARRIRQKLIYVQRNSTMYNTEYIHGSTLFVSSLNYVHTRDTMYVPRYEY